MVDYVDLKTRKKSSLLRSLGVSSGTIYTQTEERASLKAIAKFMNEVTFRVKSAKSEKSLRVHEYSLDGNFQLKQETLKQEISTLKPKVFDFHSTQHSTESHKPVTKAQAR